jgi:hypothetical protein
LVLYLDAANTRSYISGSTTWSDLSRSGNNGTLTNGPTFNSGNGGSIVFDGTNDYALINGFNLLAPLTISSWIYKTSHKIWTSILDRYGNENLDSVSLGFDSNDGQRLMYQWNNSPPFSNRVIGNTIINTNQWYYVCVTATSTTADFYVNSVFDVSRSVGQVSQTGNFYVGVNLAGGDEYYAGRIANLQVYNRALSSTEILQNYNATKTRFGL